MRRELHDVIVKKQVEQIQIRVIAINDGHGRQKLPTKPVNNYASIGCILFCAVRISGGGLNPLSTTFRIPDGQASWWDDMEASTTRKP
jgi:hypothetical protein